MQIKKMIMFFSMLFLMGLSTEAIQASEKVIIGGVEKVVLLPWGAVLPARIDTGAGFSALGVSDLKVEGKMIEFRLPGRYGGSTLRLPLSGWRCIKRADSPCRRRPAVEMELSLKKVRIRTEVTLCDRSNMEFPVLIGRKALRGNSEAEFIVDVTRSISLSSDRAKGNLP
jgi:hypothetical protein